MADLKIPDSGARDTTQSDYIYVFEIFKVSKSQPAFVVDSFRAELVEYYKSFEPQDRTFFTPDVHLKCDMLFEDTSELLAKDQTELWPWDHIAQRMTYLQKNKK